MAGDGDSDDDNSQAVCVLTSAFMEFNIQTFQFAGALASSLALELRLRSVSEMWNNNTIIR